MSEWTFFEAYRKGFCPQTHGPMLLLLWVKKKHTHNDDRESVRFVLINLEKLVGCPGSGATKNRIQRKTTKQKILRATGFVGLILRLADCPDQNRLLLKYSSSTKNEVSSKLQQFPLSSHLRHT